MTAFLVGRLDKAVPTSLTAAGKGPAGDAREFAQFFQLVEAETPEDAVSEVAEDRTGKYAVLAPDLRCVETVVV